MAGEEPGDPLVDGLAGSDAQPPEAQPPDAQPPEAQPPEAQPSDAVDAGVMALAAVRDAGLLVESERVLQEGHELWRASLDGMLEGFAVYRCVREDGEIVDFQCAYINPAGAETFKRPVSEVLGARLLTLTPLIVEDGRFAELVNVVESGEVNQQLQHHYVDDEVHGVFDSRAWKIGDGVAVTWRDITERERVTADLRASEERFRTSVQHLHDSLSVFTAIRDSSGDIVDFRWDYANEASGVITGSLASELEGRRLLEVLPDHGPSGMLEIYRQVVETGEPWVQPELWYEDVWGDGQRIRKCLDVRATKLRDGFVVVTRDVTAQHEDRKAFEAARSMIEASLDSMVAISPEGKITDANRATVKVTGFSRDALIGTSFSDYFTEPEKANEIYHRVFAEGMAVDYPLTMRHRDGSVTEILYNAAVYRDEDGNVLGVFAAARDVTSQVQSQRKLAEQQAKELDRLAELERFQRLTVGRELKMLELKKEIEILRSLVPAAGVSLGVGLGGKR